MRGATAQRPINDGLVPFQSTLLMRGATWIPPRKPCRLRNFNPRSSCEERPDKTWTAFPVDIISIHAPHARSDMGVTPPPPPFCISIHAPHARSDEAYAEAHGMKKVFQSTLLMRGATSCFFTHLFTVLISIHAPHARSDNVSSSAHADIRTFQSTLLMRGATAGRRTDAAIQPFQSTLLMRGATAWREAMANVYEFQSTLLMRGATRCASCRTRRQHHFNPRSSCEERPARPATAVPSPSISIHAPHARSDP